MARSFDDSLTQYLEATAAPVSAFPLTFAAWFKTDDATANQTIVSAGLSSVFRAIQLQASGAVAGDPIRVLISTSGGTVIASTATGYSTGVWTHACVSIEIAVASTLPKIVYIDGVGTGDTSFSGFPTLNRTEIGRSVEPAGANYMSGDVAEVGIWNINLDAGEVLALARGLCPLAVRPQNLSVYVPLIRDNDKDIVGGLSFTASGSPTIAAHPRVLYPSVRFMPSLQAASPQPAGVPVHFMHYQRLRNN